MFCSWKCYHCLCHGIAGTMKCAEPDVKIYPSKQSLLHWMVDLRREFSRSHGLRRLLDEWVESKRFPIIRIYCVPTAQYGNHKTFLAVLYTLGANLWLNNFVKLNSGGVAGTAMSPTTDSACVWSSFRKFTQCLGLMKSAPPSTDTAVLCFQSRDINDNLHLIIIDISITSVFILSSLQCSHYCQFFTLTLHMVICIRNQIKAVFECTSIMRIVWFVLHRADSCLLLGSFLLDCILVYCCFMQSLNIMYNRKNVSTDILIGWIIWNIHVNLCLSTLCVLIDLSSILRTHSISTCIVCCCQCGWNVMPSVAKLEVAGFVSAPASLATRKQAANKKGPWI